MGEYKAYMGEYQAEVNEYKAYMGEYQAEVNEYPICTASGGTVRCTLNQAQVKST